MEMQRILGPVVGAGIGWILAQATALSRERLQARKVARALVQELEDIRQQLQGVMGTYQRLLALHAHGRLEPTHPRPVSNFIFASHYKDAVLKLNQAQRIQLQTIHNFVSEVNVNSEDLKKIVLELADRQAAGEAVQLADIGRYTEMIKQHMHILFDAMWHVLHYLGNQKNPSITPGGRHDASRQESLAGVEGWIEEQWKAATEKPMEEVVSVYSPASYQWPHLRKTKR